MRIGSIIKTGFAAFALLCGGLAAAQAPAPQPGAAAAPILPGTYTPGRRPPGYADPYAGKKRVLLVADLHTGNQNAHDAVSHAMATLERITRAAGIVLYIRTDTEWVTKQEVWGTGDYAKGGRRQARGRNLKDFDAVVFYTNGELDLNDEQKAALLGFIHDDGKGFVGIHTATATATKWPEYGVMIGAYFDNHPWGISDAKVIVERPDAPEMKGYLKNPIVKDEHYQMMAPYDRANLDVLARIDTKSVDMKSPDVHRTDGDFPVAWIKNYGKGRVFYSGLGHSDASWDDPRQQTMFLEAIKWAAGVTDYPVRPHALPAK